jgi:ATP-dependent Lon protease
MDEVLKHVLVRMPEAIEWDAAAEAAAAAAREASERAEGVTAH